MLEFKEQYHARQQWLERFGCVMLVLHACAAASVVGNTVLRPEPVSPRRESCTAQLRRGYKSESRVNNACQVNNANRGVSSIHTMV